MAQFTKINGDFLPVTHLDSPAYTNSGANALSSGNAVQAQGPKLDFFTITASGSSSFSGAQVGVMIQTIQQLSTVYMYEYNAAAPDNVSFAVYPAGSWAVDNTLGANANVTAAVISALTSANLANTVIGSNSATFTTTASQSL